MIAEAHFESRLAGAIVVILLSQLSQISSRVGLWKCITYYNAQRVTKPIAIKAEMLILAEQQS